MYTIEDHSRSQKVAGLSSTLFSATTNAFWERQDVFYLAARRPFFSILFLKHTLIIATKHAT